jgi:8-oxo-dGTP pyrophosphatase MutT (NUDIX family)
MSKEFDAEETGMVIPADRLPPGFAQRIGEKTLNPVEPKPAATGVLMRDSSDGIEVLLMKRHRESGFVPGAYVFAGGRVDASDSDSRSTGVVGSLPADPPAEYWVATVREVFEETGVLLARRVDGAAVASSDNDENVASWREALMSDEASISDVLATLGVVPDYDALAYAAHWITPLPETRRYDTRFFYARMPEGCNVTADAREMSDAVWLSPRKALERFRAGSLPMVFPTVRTIGGLIRYETVDEALRDARSRKVEPIMPELVRVADGVGIVIDADRSLAGDR